MFRFHPMFWLIVALVWMFASQRRRWIRRRAMSFAAYGPVGWAPPGWAPFWGPRGDARTQEWSQQQPPATPQSLAQPDRTLVEALETRIAELETRLEFAERLMARKGE
ncbi:MAG: hypothetical protein H0U66_17255 [Gemmatimonadaceae bacterium]|nr:hypothetical protein [Gemmatimonadaceae bacterium]